MVLLALEVALATDFVETAEQITSSESFVDLVEEFKFGDLFTAVIE